MNDIERLEMVLEKYPADVSVMLMLVDAYIAIEGGELLAEAYRWASKWGRCPFLRPAHSIELRGLDLDVRGNPFSVYDWESMDHMPYLQRYIPHYAKLPAKLYQQIRVLPDRTYGGIREAYTLLGRGLVALNNAEPNWLTFDAGFITNIQYTSTNPNPVKLGG